MTSYGDPDATPIVIAVAMAVPQRFYRHLAAHLAANGSPRHSTIGHIGAFLPDAIPIWDQIRNWFGRS